MPRRWLTRVAATDYANNVITLEHALPDDFAGANPTVYPATPAEEIVLRNCLVQYESGQHLSGSSRLVITQGIAGFEMTNVGLKNGYRVALEIFNGADIRIEGSDLYDHQWDKSSNGYVVVINSSSRVEMFDNHISGVTGVAFTSEVQGFNFYYNDADG